MSWLTSDTGIIVTYVALSAVVLFAVIAGRGPWKVKVPMILVVPFMGFLIMASIARHAGWPTTDSPPNSSIIAGEYIIEPNPITKDPGVIYVWLIPPGATKPRAYKLPYTRQAHAALVRAASARKRGVPIQFKKIGQKILAYKLPPPKLPTKERS